MTHEHDPAVHIHWTEPMHEVFRHPDGERWCFVCRRRQAFEYVRTAPVGISYYGPNDRIVCSVCQTTDGDCFPGTDREWTDA